MDFETASEDATSCPLPLLIERVTNMKVLKKELESEIAELKLSRTSQLRAVFDRVFQINPKQANIAFVDFEDDSKSFQERLEYSMHDMVNNR